MCLAASRKSLTIELADAELAHQLLTKTEERMPDALGEYGMNKLSAAKQRLLEFIRGSDAPIPYDSLYGMLSRDMAPIQFRDTMHELKAAQKITTRALDGVLYVIGTSERGALKARADMTRLRNLLEPE